MLAGTPGFQSPEQLRSEACGPPSDVYAFGALMVVLFNESALWPGLNCFQIMQKVTSNVCPSTDGLPNCIKLLCNTCFSVSTSRPQIIDVLHQLQNITFI